MSKHAFELLLYLNCFGGGKNKFVFAGERAAGVDTGAEDLIVGAGEFEKFGGAAEELLPDGGAEF